MEYRVYWVYRLLLIIKFITKLGLSIVNNEKLITKLNECDEKYIVKNGDSTINGNLTVNGTITGTQSNTTITHYSPIEQSVSSINDFIIGGPIYMSGKVYKQTNEG